MPTRVELDVGEGEDVSWRAVRAPAQQRAQARIELLERERLDEVVVGPGVEPCDPVVDLVAGGEHQHRNAVTGPAKGAADIEAVEPWHQDVEDDRSGRDPPERRYSRASSPFTARSTW